MKKKTTMDFRFNLNHNHRRSIRLKTYDYTQPGMYFVTICTHNREHLLGQVAGDEMQMNDYSEIVLECWNNLPKHYTNVGLDAFVIMPNHVHGIIIINDVGAGFPCPLGNKVGETPSLLGQIVAYFKYQSAKRINVLQNAPGKRIWQRNYWEHVIRDEDSLYRIQEYILTNPLRWHLDRENLHRQGEDEFDKWLDSFHTIHNIKR